MSTFRTIALVILSGIAAFGTSGLEACAQPDDVAPPNGATATTEEIRIARATVQLFMSKMDTYLECLDQENQVKAQNSNYSAEEKESHATRYNSGVDIMEAVASQFNQQLAVFKAKKDAAAQTETTP